MKDSSTRRFGDGHATLCTQLLTQNDTGIHPVARVSWYIVLPII